VLLVHIKVSRNSTLVFSAQLPNYTSLNIMAYINLDLPSQVSLVVLDRCISKCRYLNSVAHSIYNTFSSIPGGLKPKELGNTGPLLFHRKQISLQLLELIPKLMTRPLHFESCFNTPVSSIYNTYLQCRQMESVRLRNLLEMCIYAKPTKHKLFCCSSYDCSYCSSV